MRTKINSKYVSTNKLKKQLEREWALYLNWCKIEILDAYNRVNLQEFHNQKLYEDSHGNVVIERDVAFTNSGLAYDERSTDEPREYLEEIK